MAKLNDLSAEIIDSICAHLQGYRSTLHSFCLASTKYYAIATPHLYHSIGTPGDLLSLVKTLVVYNPKLCLFVKSIDCEDYPYLVVALEDLELIRDNVSPRIGTASFEKPLLLEDPGSWYTRRLYEVIFVHCQNLQKLQIVILNCFDFEYFEYLVNKYNDGHPFLWALYAIDARHRDTEDGLDLANIIPLLKLPSMTSLFALRCYMFKTSLGREFPQLKELRLENTGLELREIIWLVECCPKLESFYYEAGDACVENVDIASSLQISEALLPLRTTLCMLYLNHSEHTLALAGEYEGIPIGSLKSLDKLEVLGIWQDDLTLEQAENDAEEEHVESGENGSKSAAREQGSLLETTGPKVDPFVHELPKSLQTLYITDTNDLLNPELVNLARSAPTEFPNLEVVKIGHHVRLDIHEVFEEAGIKLERLKDHEAQLAFPCSW